MNREFSSFLPSFPPAKRLSALTITSPTISSPVLPPEPLPSPPTPLPHLSASRVLFEEGLYSDVTVMLQVPGSIKKSFYLHSRILSRESELFETLLSGNKLANEKAITLLEERDSHGSQVIEIQCMDAQELYTFESSLRLIYTGSWCSDRDFQTSSLGARVRRGLDVLSQASRLILKGTTSALLQEEITQMCKSQPELLEKVSKSLRSEDREDEQGILIFDRDALQQLCRVAVTKTEIRDHCELAIARNLYGAKKFRDLRMSEVQLSELRPGYLFPPGGQESIYLLKGAPSLPLHPCRATNIEALRHVVDHYTAYNSQQPLRTREFYVIPTDDEIEDDDDTGHRSVATLHDVTFYRVAFSTGYRWLMDQVIKIRAPFQLIILLLKDAIDENADGSNNVAFGEFTSSTDGDVYLQEYPGLSTLIMEFIWQVLELALKRPHHLEFVQLLLESITKIAPLTPFEVFDRIEERLAELLEETRKKIMEQRGDVPQAEEETLGDDDATDDESDIVSPRVTKDRSEDAFPEGHRSEVSCSRSDDPEERYSMVSRTSVLLAPEPDKNDDASSIHQDDEQEDADVEAEAPWMRPEYLQPLCLQLLTTFPMNIQSSLMWAIHDLQLL
ncbi:hypothetical protein BGZ65_000312 [Modicella reniformis]|uniref:BTB domain-containing protein n=1 Tax=Modicella reniformis TaxID=1440133 RepID=A0A9P6LUD9_9FUNG|nr:hypothetical protein BGZ65_000312 [Modicella reniformis]